MTQQQDSHFRPAPGAATAPGAAPAPAAVPPPGSTAPPPDTTQQVVPGPASMAPPTGIPPVSAPPPGAVPPPGYQQPQYNQVAQSNPYPLQYPGQPVGPYGYQQAPYGYQPNLRAPALPPDAPSPPDVDDPRLSWRTALLGIAYMFGVLIAMVVVIGIIAGVSGSGTEDLDSQGINFVLSLLQDAGMVAAAFLAVRSVVKHPSPVTFGFRGMKWSYVGWAALALVGFFVLSAVYTAVISQLVDLPKNPEKVDDQLGPVLTAIFAICIAPPVEELFFRGLLYRSFRNSMGIVLAAILSGLIFGSVHFGSADPIFIPMLAALGVILALVYQKTNSLWTCILLHATYNAIVVAIAFA